MTYNNLATQVTSVSGTWSGAAISFSTLGLSTSIPFKDQIEVERIFSSSAFTAVKDNITTSDLHKIFLLEKTEYTITGNTISAFSMNGSRSYTLTGGTNSGTAIPIPAISNGDSVIIRRKTLSIDTYVTWAPGTKLTTTQLNQQVGQLLRLNQELMYKLDSEYVRAADLSGSVAPVLAVNNNLNMNSFQILNLATPSSAVGSDSGAGANKGYVDTNFVNKSTAQTGIAGAKTFTGAMTLSSGLTVDTNTLVVDATNDRVGIGTASPTGKLHVVGNTKVTSGTAGGVQSDITNMSGIHLDGGIANSSTSSILYSSGGGGGAAMSFYRNAAYQTGIILSTNTASSANTTTERMRIDPDGNVGIGTASPTTKLQVAVPSTGTTLTGTNKYGGIHLTQNNVNDEFTGITTAGPSSGTQGGILFQGAGTYGIKMHFLTTDNFDSGMKNRMTLDHLGRLGIGTTSIPTIASAKLHVVGDAGTICSLQSNAASPVTQVMGYIGAGNDIAYTGTYSNHTYSLITNNTARMAIDATGNVGIGTAGPSYTLDVVGTGRFNNAANANKLLIEGYGNALAYGIQFTPANNTSTFPCRFHNAAGTLVGSIQTDASTAIFNGTVNGSVMGNIGTTIVVTLPNYATALASTANSGFCSKPAASNVVTLPTGTWIGYAVNMSAAGVVSAIANIPATSGAITCSGLTSGSTNLVNLVLMRSA